MRCQVRILILGGGVVELRVQALADAGEDEGDIAAWTSGLLIELLDVDGVLVDALPGDAPHGSKGAGAAAGALLARLASADTFRTLLKTVRAWTARTGRAVEVSINGDVLKLARASRGQQDRVIEAWFSRHAPVA